MACRSLRHCAYLMAEVASTEEAVELEERNKGDARNDERLAALNG